MGLHLSSHFDKKEQSKTICILRRSDFMGTDCAQTEEILSVHDTNMGPLDAMSHEGAVLHNEGLLP